MLLKHICISLRATLVLLFKTIWTIAAPNFFCLHNFSSLYVDIFFPHFTHLKISYKILHVLSEHNHVTPQTLKNFSNKVRYRKTTSSRSKSSSSIAILAYYLVWTDCTEHKTPVYHCLLLAALTSSAVIPDRVNLSGHCAFLADFIWENYCQF